VCFEFSPVVEAVRLDCWFVGVQYRVLLPLVPYSDRRVPVPMAPWP
jgi:hypothetical protein